MLAFAHYAVSVDFAYWLGAICVLYIFRLLFNLFITNYTDLYTNPFQGMRNTASFANGYWSRRQPLVGSAV